MTVEQKLVQGWWQVDPKAEHDYSGSPYNAMYNNPISFNDPEGDCPFCLVVGLGAINGIFSNGLSNLSNGQNFFNGAGKAALWGGVSAAASYGIGEAIKAGGFGTEVLRAGAHGISTGIQSELQGGSFGQGFLSGSISSGIGSGIGGLGGGKFDQILGGGLGGGIGAALAGGNFFEGLGQGIAVGAFNHALHGAFQGGLGDPPTKEELKVYLAGEFLDGRISRKEYLNAIALVDDGPWGLFKNVVSNNKYDIAMTALPIGRVSGAIIKGFTKHGLNQAITRGFQSKDILNIVRNGNARVSLGRYGLQTKYTLGGNSVVVNNLNNKVVTVFSTNVKNNGYIIR